MDTVGLPFLFTVLVLTPGLGILSWHYLRKNKIFPKEKRYSLYIAAQVWLLILALAAAAAEKISLFPARLPSSRAWIFGAIFLSVIVAQLRFGWRRMEESAKQRFRLFLPETQKEFWYWVPVSVVAGAGEECAYRGAAYALLVLITRSDWKALVLCVLAFALAHLGQGWKSAAKIGIFGLLSHVAVFLTGSLYLSIAVHIAYDLLVGWLVVRLLTKEGIGAARSVALP